MTISSASTPHLPPPQLSASILALVRLLAREAARAEFATRCNAGKGEMANV